MPINPCQDFNLMKINFLILAIALSAVEAEADSTLDAAIGGGLGGAAGAAIGNELGGRDGAIIGGALGGAAGAAVSTDKHSGRYYAPRNIHFRRAPYRGGHPHGYHCPPGQRKKGRC